MTKARVLVTGAGGFIGHHLVRRLKDDGSGFEEPISRLPNLRLVRLTNLRCSTCGSGKTA